MKHLKNQDISHRIFYTQKAIELTIKPAFVRPPMISQKSLSLQAHTSSLHKYTNRKEKPRPAAMAVAGGYCWS